MIHVQTLFLVRKMLLTRKSTSGLRCSSFPWGLLPWALCCMVLAWTVMLSVTILKYATSHNPLLSLPSPLGSCHGVHKSQTSNSRVSENRRNAPPWGACNAYLCPEQTSIWSYHGHAHLHLLPILRGPWRWWHQHLFPSGLSSAHFLLPHDHSGFISSIVSWSA